jgi:hypothetical protein
MEEKNAEIVKFNMLEDNDIEQAQIIFQSIDNYVRRYLKKKIDYGTIPYCGNKPVLFKAGAEKLLRLFQLVPQFQLVDSIVDYPNKLFHYHYRCSLYRKGILVGESDGLANSKETKFLRKGTFDFSAVNTLAKIGQKRAMVGATLIVCGVSEYFTQDLNSY